MRKHEYIYLHCSASHRGCATIINEWHLENGWSGIGYHNVFPNGWIGPGQREKWEFMDGTVEAGRPIDDDGLAEPQEIGAHVYGFNHGVGLCLIGKGIYTTAQLVISRRTILEYCNKFDIPTKNVLGHYEAGKVDPRYAVEKTCPNLPMNDYRAFLRYEIDLSDMINRMNRHYNFLRTAPKEEVLKVLRGVSE